MELTYLWKSACLISLSSGFNLTNIMRLASHTYLIFLLMKNMVRHKPDPFSPAPELLAPFPPDGRTTTSSNIWLNLSFQRKKDKLKKNLKNLLVVCACFWILYRLLGIISFNYCFYTIQFDTIEWWIGTGLCNYRKGYKTHLVWQFQFGFSPRILEPFWIKWFFKGHCPVASNLATTNNISNKATEIVKHWKRT